MRKKCGLFVHFLRKKCGSPHFSALFLESAETPLFVQINVFAVWPLRLDRKYTILINICVFEAVGIVGREENRPKTLSFMG